ncbi:MAG: HNH endonuclease [Candidatus Promineifilaceae bacterium]
MAAVLLLNASFEPLRVIPFRRAVSLLMRDRVDAVSAETHNLPTASTIVEIPHVLRLRKYVNVPRRGVRWSRRNVFIRDNWTCIYCGVQLNDFHKGRVVARDSFTLDHIKPRSKGGKNTWSNTACACASCNQRKGARLPNEANMKLLWEPKRPRVDYLVASGDVPEAWKLYLTIGKANK